MAGTQTITTSIVINAKTGTGFTEVGNTLTEMGTMISGLSDQIINFGKDSASTYRDYEYSMKEAETALATKYGEGSKQLTDVMSQLDAAASQWAETSIFHTNDIANAINNAAHANWDMNQILGGMPAVMQLAQAGGMDLSQAFEYVAASMAGLNVPYEELNEFVDMWTFAANSSLGDAQSFGETMSAMGSVMQFTGSREELFSLIGLMHDMGTSGSEAATMLRTSMLRILAPSGTAAKALGEMNDMFGATQEEIDGILADAENAEAIDLLKAYGFSAYDAEGQAKPMLEIFSDLGTVLADIAGGWENITSNESTLGIMNKVFGTRGIIGATNIVNGLQNAVSLQNQLIEGAHQGYGEYSSEVMNKTFYGQIELLGSKIERLEQRTGEVLSAQLEPIMTFLGDLVSSISNLDEGTFNMLVSGVEAIAAAGLGMLGAGTALRLIGSLVSPTGALALGVTVLTTAAAAISEIKEAEEKGAFGTATMDQKEIMSYVSGLNDSFASAYTEVNKFNTALETSVTNYEKASSTFSSNLLTDLITNTTLTPEQIDSYKFLGEQMYQSLVEGINASMGASASYLEMLFGGEGTAEYDPNFQYLIELTDESYNSALLQAQTLSQGLRDAMTSAFDDGEVSPEEYQELLDYMRAYNEAMERAAAETESRARREELSKQLHRAQTASLDDIKTIGDEIEEERAAAEEAERDAYYTELAKLTVAHEDRLASMTDKAAIEEETRAYESALAAMENSYDARMAEVVAPYDNALIDLYTSQVEQSDDAKKAHEALDSRIREVSARALQAQGYEVGMYGTDRSVSGILDLTEGTEPIANLTAYVNGDTTNLQATITEEDGQEITIAVDGDASGLDALLSSYEGRTIHFNLIGKNLLGGGDNYAEGGRATAASVFGEAGPEWAIPEEHSQRTADLLNAARQASGFTWPDLLSRFGGLNANSGNTPSTIIYSPTINAADATGVDRVLRDDKARMEKWMRDREMRTRLEAFA